MKITIFAMEIVNNGKTAVQEVNIETTSGKLNERPFKGKFYFETINK